MRERDGRRASGPLPWLLFVSAALAFAGCKEPPSRAPTNATSSAHVEPAKPSSGILNPALEARFVRWEQAGPTGDAPHRERLEQLAGTVRKRLADSSNVDLVFICTHNSRRSHIAQILGLAAARRQGLKSVRTFSGGTEATAFNPRAIAALARVGVTIASTSSTPSNAKNPHYAVALGPSVERVDAFSKRFGDPPNPQGGFVAVMTCSQADAACPLVQGAATRLAVPYEDPKVADGTPEEAAKYDERVEQIGRDLVWVFAQVGAERRQPSATR